MGIIKESKVVLWGDHSPGLSFGFRFFAVAPLCFQFAYGSVVINEATGLHFNAGSVAGLRPMAGTALSWANLL